MDKSNRYPDFMWADLVHLGINSWADCYLKDWGPWKRGTPDEHCVTLRQAEPYMRTTDEEWRFCVDGLVKAGANTLVIDMAEGIQYESHPELAVKGSWSIEKFRRELDRIRAMGVVPIPKMNFSTAHDTWLKDYHRMVSTPEYYRVCEDVIREVCEIFDHPRYFHLGYDEETAANQAKYECVVVRQGELWWHDFLWFDKVVEGLGARPWIWADRVWHHREEFERRMPKSVLLSNWYYGKEFDVAKLKSASDRTSVSAYEWLEKAGFDQVPCGTNRDEDFACLPNTVAHCVPLIAPERLKGFCLAPWSRQVPEYRRKNETSFRAMAAAKAKYAELKG